MLTGYTSSAGDLGRNCCFSKSFSWPLQQIRIELNGHIDLSRKKYQLSIAIFMPNYLILRNDWTANGVPSGWPKDTSRCCQQTCLPWDLTPPSETVLHGQQDREDGCRSGSSTLQINAAPWNPGQRNDLKCPEQSSKPRSSTLAVISGLLSWAWVLSLVNRKEKCLTVMVLPGSCRWLYAG